MKKKKPLKIGVFGGTFNPPHKGHTLLLSEIESKVHFDKVIIVPSSIPPHKEVARNNPMHRLEMTKLAFPGHEISDMEIVRGGKSYTWETLTELKRTYPLDKLCFICGSDMFLTMDTWKNPKTIFSLARIITASRDKKSYHKLIMRKIYYFFKFGASCMVVQLEPVIISSSEIRETEADGEDISKWVCPEVKAYIDQYNLYSGGNNDR